MSIQCLPGNANLLTVLRFADVRHAIKTVHFSLSRTSCAVGSAHFFLLNSKFHFASRAEMAASGSVSSISPSSVIPQSNDGIESQLRMAAGVQREKYRGKVMAVFTSGGDSQG